MQINIAISIDIPCLGTGWQPTDIGSDLALWLRPEDLPASGAITQWDDASGNDNHAAEATNTPVVLANVIDGKAGADFDGVDDLLTLQSEIQDANGVELWAVMNKAAGGSTHVPFAGGVSGNDYLGFLAGAPDSPLVFRTSDVGSTTVSTNSFPGEDFLVRVARDASNNLSVEKNGVDVTTGTPSNAGRFDFQTLGQRVGGSSVCDFTLVELVVSTSPLVATDVRQLYSYLSARYPSLSITVPAAAAPGNTRTTSGGGTRTISGGNDRTHS